MNLPSNSRQAICENSQCFKSNCWLDKVDNCISFERNKKQKKSAEYLTYFNILLTHFDMRS